MTITREDKDKLNDLFDATGSDVSADPVLVRAVEAIAHATVALDGQANAMAWLRKPNPHLANKTPLLAICHAIFDGDPTEIDLLDELLSALENGIHV
jgi:hypothetical protein